MTAPGPDKDQMLSVSPRSCPGLGLKGCSWWISQLDSSWGWLSLLGFAAFKKFHFLLWDKNKSKNGGKKNILKENFHFATSHLLLQHKNPKPGARQDKTKAQKDVTVAALGVE